MADSTPYLSIVATSRNDDHGGNPAQRTQVFVDTLAAHCAVHDLPAELVLVEWNPPAARPPLSAALRWPMPDAALSVRIVTVPTCIHDRFAHADALPLFQMKAKNAGIRRSRGDFVLATNIDIVLSKPLIAFLARRTPRPGRLYRIERHDVAPEPPAGAALDSVLDHCARHVVRINRRDASLDSGGGSMARVYPVRHRVVGHLPRAILRNLAHGITPWSAGGRAALAASWASIRDEFARPQLLTNASGDFMLMDRASWHALHGYAEWDTYSFHLDAIFCHQAAASGRREVFLKPPMVAWHIEHARGSGFAPEDPDALWRRLDAAGVPWLDGDRAQAIVRDLHRGRMAPAINGADWGLAGLDLDEFLPAAAAA
jgi:hypothetical protein